MYRVRCFDFPKTIERLTIVNLFSIYVFVQRLMNYYPNYSSRCLYFREVETPYS